MYSQFSVKELAIGRNTPIKLRLVTNHRQLNHHGIVQKLTQMLTEKVTMKHFPTTTNPNHHQLTYHPKSSKENRYRVSESGPRAASSMKAKRVISQKYPNIAKDRKRGSQPDKYFTEFFQLFNSGQTEFCSRIQNFTPYRKQESYKGKELGGASSQGISSRKGCGRLARCGEEVGGGISKWETGQQSLGSSFVEQK